MNPKTAKKQSSGQTQEATAFYYCIGFRENERPASAQSSLPDLKKNEVILVKTDHGLEPAVIKYPAPYYKALKDKKNRLLQVSRRATQDEQARYAEQPSLEAEAFQRCKQRIANLKLPMQLVRVERYFSGNKIIFFFTADNRIDFRDLVKFLAQEFRTRVEMRQIGVRHETRMTGGLGPCGRELCCSSFLNKFESVSIKMAKMQDLPLNPAKISGLCNRLFCCLTYENEAYRTLKSEMPRVGKWLKHEGTRYRVSRIMPLQDKVLAVSKEGQEIRLSREQWQPAEPQQQKGPSKPRPRKK